MSFQPLDQFAARLPRGVQALVHDYGVRVYERRTHILAADFPRPDDLRQLAGAIKQHTLENLDRYLEQAEARLQDRGAQVHWARTAEEANTIVLGIMQRRGAKRLVKSKSMLTEETELLPFLERHGIDVVETDLGEFIVQIDHDHPSHVVGPIIHKNRQDVARSFERIGLGAYDDDPAVITRRARAHLRRAYLTADVGLTGANFVAADSGRLVIVTNEGNSRFCLAPVPVHIAMVGIEKLVPHDRDLALFLNLLARSASGQRLSVYTEFINGPRRAGQPHGPDEMHVVFVDNGRTKVLASEYQEILRCIRCGACMNVCPVYRQAGGHAYRSVYPGPLGAVLSPLLATTFSDKADLPRASSLCGACQDVCPVDIAIPDLLVRLRDKAAREAPEVAPAPSLGPWAAFATRPGWWRRGLAAGHMLNTLPHDLLPMAALQTWREDRDLPEWRGGKFRAWFETHQPIPRGGTAAWNAGGGRRPEAPDPRAARPAS